MEQNCVGAEVGWGEVDDGRGRGRVKGRFFCKPQIFPACGAVVCPDYTVQGPSTRNSATPIWPVYLSQDLQTRQRLCGHRV